MAIGFKDGHSRSERTREENRILLEQDVANLSDEELETLRLVLKGFADPKASKTGVEVFKEMSDLEFKRTPVGVKEFVQDDYYLGYTCDTLYPRLLEDLEELFEGAYREVILTGAIGWGKTFFGSIGVCYLLYQLSCMQDPHHSFGIARNSNITIACLSVNETLATKVAYENIATKIEASPYFQEHYPFEKTKKELRFPSKVWVAARASNDSSVLGLNVIGGLLDECLTPNSAITLADESVAFVKDLPLDAPSKVVTFDTGGGLRVADAWVKKSGIQQCFEVVLDNGKSLSASWHHPVLTQCGGVLDFKLIADIKVGEEVVIYASKGSETFKRGEGEDFGSCEEKGWKEEPVLWKDAFEGSAGEDSRGSEELHGLGALRGDEGENVEGAKREAKDRSAESEAVRSNEGFVGSRGIEACSATDRGWREEPVLRKAPYRGGEEEGRGCESWAQAHRRGKGEDVEESEPSACRSSRGAFDSETSYYSEGRKDRGSRRLGASGCGAAGIGQAREEVRIRNASGAIPVFEWGSVDCCGFQDLACRRIGEGCRGEGCENEIAGSRKNGSSTEVLRRGRLGPRCLGRELSVAKVVSKRDLGVQPTYDVSVPGYECFVADGVLVHNTNYMRKAGPGRNDPRFDMYDHADVLYNAMQRRMKSRFERKGRLPGILFVVSSKQTQDDFTAKRIKESLTDPTVFVRDYCLTGDTRIPLLDGTTKTIKELVDQHGGSEERFGVYSFDVDHRCVVPGKAHHPRLTAKNEPIVRVTLDNGEVIRCTGWHPFLLKSGEYRRAEELSKGDSLMPLYRRLDSRGYEEVLQPWRGGVWQKTHHMVAKGKYGGWPKYGKDGKRTVIHHENYNKRDNREDNLSWREWTWHQEHHAECRVVLERYVKSERHRDYASKRMADLHKDPLFARNRDIRGSAHFKALWRDESFRKMAAKAAGKRLSDFHKSPIGRLRQTERNEKRWSTRRKLASDDVLEGAREGLSISTLAKQHDCCPAAVSQVLKRAGLPLYSDLKRSYGHFSPGNHKVVSVEVDEAQDVYDLSVDRHENFALEAGVFVHNSLWDVKPEAYYSGEWFHVVVGNEATPSRILKPNEDPEEVKSRLPEDCVLIQVPSDFERDFESDLEGAICDLAGVATVSVSPFIQRRDKILEAVDTSRRHPFSPMIYDPSEPGNFRWGELVQVYGDAELDGILKNKPILNRTAPRHIHIDPSLRGDATGFCMAHISGWRNVLRKDEDGKQYAERAPIFTVDVILKIVPPVGGEIMLGDIRRLVYQLSQHGFLITCVSQDRYQCLVKGTRISTNRGLLPIEEVQVGDLVQSRVGPRKVKNTWMFGKRPTLRIETSDGDVLEGTDLHKVEVAVSWKDVYDHPVLGHTREPVWEWRTLSELRVGDVINLVDTPVDLDVEDTSLFGDKRALGWRRGGGRTSAIDAWEFPTKMTVELAELLGLIWGDGDIGEDGIRLTVTEEESEDACRVFQAVFGIIPEFQAYSNKEGCGVLRISSRWLVRWLRINNLVKPLVPDAVLRSSRAVKAAFLKGLFAADGNVGRVDGKVSLSTKYRKLVDTVRLMLRVEFGLVSHLTIVERGGNGDYITEGTQYVVSLRGQRVSFYEKIGFSYSRKMDELAKHLEVRGRRLYPRIVSVSVGEGEVFDLAVEEDPSYVAGGFVSHNSADSIQKLNQKGYNAMIISVDTSLEPYQRLKEALYENRMNYYEYPPLIQELQKLQLDKIRRKVDHPRKGSKDLSDALAGVVFTLTETSLHMPVPMMESIAVDPDDAWLVEQQHRAYAENASAGSSEMGADMLPPFFCETMEDGWEY